MNRLIAIVCLFLGGVTMSLGQEDQNVFPYPYQRVNLKNGFTAYLVNTGASGSFSYVTMVRTGSRDEFEPGKSGFAHFFEHMMFRGTERYPNFDDIIAQMGAASNAFTSDDMTVYYISAASEYLEKVFDLESDRFMNLSYSEDAFKTEAGAVLGEQQQSKFSPFNYLEQHIRLAAYDKHTYRHTTIGYEEDVRNMPTGYQYSKSFHQRHYRPENCVLVLVGDFSNENAKNYVENFYGKWAKGYQEPPIPKEAEQKELRETIVSYPSKTLPILAYNYKGPAWSASDPLAVATEVLGQLAFGANSDIYKRLVIQEQRLQSLTSGFRLSKDPSLLQVFATVMDLSDVGAVRAEIEATVQAFQAELVDAQKLQDVKDSIKYRLLMGLETPRGTAFSVMRFVINTGTIEAIEEYAKTLNQVTPEHVRQAARTYLRSERNTIATMLQKGTELPTNTPGVIELQKNNSPFVAFNAWVKTGSQNDPKGKEGLAALTAALLNQSATTLHSYEEIRARLYPMSAGFSYNVDKEMTVFTGTVHRDHLYDFYALFKERILTPGFKSEDFDRVKSNTLNYAERLRRYSRDEELSKELLMTQIFMGTPFEHPEEGYVQSIKALTLEDVISYYQDQYRKDNIVVAIGGGYPTGFASQVRRDFDLLGEGAPEPVAQSSAKMPEGIHILLVEKETNAAPVSIGFPTSLTRNHEDFFAMMVVNSWFGEHRNSFSHLYQVIREARGMNYGDYSYIEAFPLGYTTQIPPLNNARRSQIFEIWLRPVSEKKPDTLHDQTLFAIRAALRELTLLTQNGMTQADLDKTKGFLKNFTVGYAETTQRRLDYAVDDAFYGMDEGFLSQLKSGIASVTLDQANKAIRKHIQANNLNMVIVTQNATQLKQKILSGDPTMLTYGGEQPADHVEEDKIIASFPIKVAAENIQIIAIEDVYEKR